MFGRAAADSSACAGWSQMGHERHLKNTDRQVAGQVWPHAEHRPVTPCMRERKISEEYRPPGRPPSRSI